MFLNVEDEMMMANGQQQICEVLGTEGGCKPDACNGSCIGRYGARSSGRCFPDDNCYCRVDCVA